MVLNYLSKSQLIAYKYFFKTMCLKDPRYTQIYERFLRDLDCINKQL